MVDELAKLVADLKNQPHLLVSKLESFLLKAKGTPPGPAKPESTSTVPKVVNPNGSKAKSEKPRSSPLALARQCWPVGEVREFSEVLRSLEAGETPKGSITVASSVDKALELKQLAPEFPFRFWFWFTSTKPIGCDKIDEQNDSCRTEPNKVCRHHCAGSVKRSHGSEAGHKSFGFLWICLSCYIIGSGFAISYDIQ